MKETLAQMTAAPVIRFGREWKLVLSDFGELQNCIDMPKQFKVLIGVGDIIRWCNTPVGIDECLTIASRRCGDPIPGPELDDIHVSDKIQLIGDLIESFIGGSSGSADADGDGGQASDPLSG